MELIPDYDWERDEHLFKYFIDDYIEDKITAEVERQGLMPSLEQMSFDRRITTISGVILTIRYLHDIDGHPRTMRRLGQARKWLERRGLA